MQANCAAAVAADQLPLMLNLQGEYPRNTLLVDTVRHPGRNYVLGAGDTLLQQGNTYTQEALRAAGPHQLSTQHGLLVWNPACPVATLLMLEHGLMHAGPRGVLKTLQEDVLLQLAMPLVSYGCPWGFAWEPLALLAPTPTYHTCAHDNAMGTPKVLLMRYTQPDTGACCYSLLLVRHTGPNGRRINVHQQRVGTEHIPKGATVTVQNGYVCVASPGAVTQWYYLAVHTTGQLTSVPCLRPTSAPALA